MKILEGEIGTEITLSSFNEGSDFAINSPGGYVYDGLAIYDFMLNRENTVHAIGLVASAATLPLLAATKRYGTPNSRYLIHNPWGVTIGESKDFEQAARSLREEELVSLRIYEKHLKIPSDEIINLINDNRVINAEEALRIGLITEIRDFNNNNKEETPETSDLKALYNHFKFNNEMKEQEQFEKRLSTVEKIFNSFKSLISPKMLVLQDVNGVELDFGNEIETVEQIQVGATATANGQPANGDYVLPNSKTYVFENGSLIEIKEASSEQDLEMVKQENEQLKTVNEQLQANFEKVKKEHESFKSKVEEQTVLLNKEISELKALSSVEPTPEAIPEPEKKEEIKKFSYKKQ